MFYCTQSVLALCITATLMKHLIDSTLYRVYFQVDDGFWEGELDGRIGVFPSLLVEFLHDKEEKEEEEEKEEKVVSFNPTDI